MVHVLDVLVKNGYVIAENAEDLFIIAEGTGDGFQAFEFRPDKTRSTKNCMKTYTVVITVTYPSALKSNSLN